MFQSRHSAKNDFKCKRHLSNKANLTTICLIVRVLLQRHHKKKSLLSKFQVYSDNKQKFLFNYLTTQGCILRNNRNELIAYKN